MVSSWILLLVSVAYAALLFGVAWWGDRRPMYPDRPWLRPVVYSLALAVYCSSWTFYGAVGTAVRNGVGYLPIYIGPLLLLLFGWRIIERLALIARSQNVVSIADFISSRFGRSRRLAALVAIIALIGIIPYLALQYKAVAMSLQVLTGNSGPTGFFTDPALYVALLMALFATLFGTRQVDATEHHHGMMLAIAFESVIKLLAMLAVGVFAYLWLSNRTDAVVESVHTLFTGLPPVGFISQTLLSFLAIICLPRQFHVAVVECGDVRDVRRARWMFGGYLVLISAMVLPIATAGVSLFGVGSGVADDSMVLALPERWVGQQAAYALTPGQAIRQNMVRPSQAFEAGAPVKVSASGRGFAVVVTGQALSTGLVGQAARVRLPNGKVVTGLVRADQSVDLSL